MLYLKKKPDRRQSWLDQYRKCEANAKNKLIREFYQAGLPDPKAPIHSTDFVALDFETTGLDVAKDAIVSVGLVPFTSQSVYCKGAKHWLFKPESPLAENSIVIHGITHSEIQRAPDLSFVLDQLLAALAGKLVVVHYRQIERNFLNKALMTRIGEGLIFPVIDTMQLENQVLHADQTLWQKILGKNIAGLRLADCRKRYGLPHYEPHHALTDAMATAELFMAQLAHKIEPDTPVERLWV